MAVCFSAYNKRKIQVCHLLYMTGSTRKIMLNYIERNVPAGVGIEVKSFKLVRFPEDLRVSEELFMKKFMIMITDKVFRKKFEKTKITSLDQSNLKIRLVKDWIVIKCDDWVVITLKPEENRGIQVAVIAKRKKLWLLDGNGVALLPLEEFKISTHSF